MRKIILFPAVAAMLSLGACASDFGNRDGYYDGPRHDRRDARQSRHMGDNDHIYRDRDGRYYCKRSDGTTGTIIGGLAGGVLGNIIAPGGSKTLGTILGAGGGALAGRAIDRNNIRCE